MKPKLACQKTMVALGALTGLLAAAPATAITPPGTPPTFYCDADRPAGTGLRRSSIPEQEPRFQMAPTGATNRAGNG